MAKRTTYFLRRGLQLAAIACFAVIGLVLGSCVIADPGSFVGDREPDICEPGYKDCTCTAWGSCFPGLACKKKRCVPAPEDDEPDAFGESEQVSNLQTGDDDPGSDDKGDGDDVGGTVDSDDLGLSDNCLGLTAFDFDGTGSTGDLCDDDLTGGDDDTIDPESPDGTSLPPVGPETVEGLIPAAGGSHSCVRSVYGEVFCWGSNAAHLLGNGTVENSSVPKPVVDLLGQAIGLAAGAHETCTILQEGEMYCWGGPARSRPEGVTGLDDEIVDISAGKAAHSCAVLQTGGISCWGLNNQGELGDGSFTFRPLAVRVSGIDRGRSVGAGRVHSCALLADGSVMCWGTDTNGQLGDGGDIPDISWPRPKPVELPRPAVTLAVGGDHSCALLDNGAVYCWGRNEPYGQLGDGTVESSSSPVAVAGLSAGVRGITAGSDHTCAIVEDESIRCWGRNDKGQLGNGSNINYTTPVAVSNLIHSPTRVSAGTHHTCATFSDDSLACWGSNILGQLGNGGGGNGVYEDEPVYVTGYAPEEPSEEDPGGSSTSTSTSTSTSDTTL